MVVLCETLDSFLRRMSERQMVVTQRLTHCVVKTQGVVDFEPKGIKVYV